VEFSFRPDFIRQAGVYDRVRLYFDKVKQIEVQLSVNGVPFDIIRISGSEFHFPKDPASLSVDHETANFSIRHTLSSQTFGDTKREYDRLTAATSTPR
jgi:hypothetical protein